MSLAGAADIRGVAEFALPGPIAITGANGFIGFALQARLELYPNKVRPLDRNDDVRTALQDAQVVVHLAGGLTPKWPDNFRSANLESVRATIAALKGSRVEQLILLSFLGADPHSSNTYLRMKGLAEDAVRACAVPATIFRCTHAFGPPERPGPLVTAYLAQGERSVKVLGSGAQRWSPIFVEDVVDAILHASLGASTAFGTFALSGPEAMSVDQFVDRINRRSVPKRHISGIAARVAGYITPGLSPDMVAVLVDDCESPDTTAADRFSLALHTVASVWGGPLR